MDKPSQRCCVGVLIAALAAFAISQAAGSVAVYDSVKPPIIGWPTGGEDIGAQDRPIDLGASVTGPPAPTWSRVEHSPWPNSSTCLPSSFPLRTWATDPKHTRDGLHNILADAAIPLFQHLYSYYYASADDIALQIESPALENAAGVGAVMPPPGTGRTSGEGDPGHTAFQVTGGAEPFSSLPVIPAPVAILLAGFSAVLIGWSRHRRAM